MSSGGGGIRAGDVANALAFYSTWGILPLPAAARHYCLFRAHGRAPSSTPDYRIGVSTGGRRNSVT